MIRLEEKIMVNRSIEEVFNFVADGENMTLWNSAVFKIEKVSTGPLGVGTQFWMLRNLPSGRAENIFEVITYKPNTEFSIKTISGPTPFVYHYHFTSVDSSTSLTLVAEIKLNGLGKIVKPLLAIGIRKGIKDNLNTLKRLMQTRETRPAHSIS
jgi:hypothetical protein